MYPDRMPYSIRTATLADSPAIHAIRNRAIRESLALWTNTELTPEQGDAWLAPQIDRGTALVAVDSAGVVVGFATASPLRAYEGYIHNAEDSIYLTESARGKGLGTELLAALIDASRSVGDRTMTALIEAGNSASIALHTTAGFRIVGTIPAAGEKFGEVLDLTIMYLAL